MDLFENALNGNGRYARPVPERVRKVMIPEFEENDSSGAVVGGDVNVSILPHNSILVSS